MSRLASCLNQTAARVRDCNRTARSASRACTADRYVATTNTAIAAAATDTLCEYPDAEIAVGDN